MRTVRPKVFPSYRHADNRYVTDRTDHHLWKRFGYENVFKAVYGIRLGADFRESLDRAVRQCADLTPKPLLLHGHPARVRRVAGELPAPGWNGNGASGPG